jgi:hypothetical protein
MKTINRKKKIEFILGARFGVYAINRTSDDFINWLRSEYEKMLDDELLTEYKFYKGLSC